VPPPETTNFITYFSYSCFSFFPPPSLYLQPYPGYLIASKPFRNSSNDIESRKQIVLVTSPVFSLNNSITFLCFPPTRPMFLQYQPFHNRFFNRQGMCIHFSSFFGFISLFFDCISLIFFHAFLTRCPKVVIPSPPHVQFHKHQTLYKTSHQLKTRNRPHTKMLKNMLNSQHTMRELL